MAEKVTKLGLERDYKQYLYFIDKAGNVARKQKAGEKLEEVVAKDAVVREKGYLYFIDKEGDVSRTASKSAKGAAPEAHSENHPEAHHTEHHG